MKKYINILMIVFLAGSLTSCLKDKYNALDPAGSPRVVEIKNPGTISSLTPLGALYSMYSAAYKAAPSVDVTYTVQLSGADAAPQDVTVTLGSDPDAVTAFNLDQKSKNSNWVNYDLAPATLYTIKQTTVVIPAGQRSVNFVISYKVDQFDFSKKYIFPIAIKSTSFGAVSKNFGTVMLNISPKNAYDGVYRYQSTNTLRGTVDEQGAKLVTVGADGVSTPLVNYYTAASNLLIYRINPVTNKVTIEGGGIGAITVDPSSNWNPATQTLYVKWNTSNRNFEETWTRTGDRN